MHARNLIAQVVACAALCLVAGCGDDEGGPVVGSPPTFTEMAGLDLTGVSNCSLAWGDAEGDGDLDLAVAGDDSIDFVAKVYENDGGAFDGTEIATGLTGVYHCSLAWGDTDNDGDLDLAVAGFSSSGRVTKVYENDEGAFDGTEIATGLTGVAYCSLAWGDCDSDGDLDLAVAGETGSGYITRVYENVGGAFDGTEIATGLTGVAYCSLAWGDADNDGDLDLAVAGFSGSGRVTKIYENDGAGGFTEFPGLDLTGVSHCFLAWGDAEGDGDLDLAVAGETGSGYITRV